MFIYKTTNLVNGLIYVGLHTKNNPKYLGSGTLLVKAVAEFGRHNFKRIILEECETRGHLNAREKYWIKKLDSMNPLVGYNLLPGGNSRGFKREVRRSKAEIFKDLRPLLRSSKYESADDRAPKRGAFTDLAKELKDKISEYVKSGNWNVLRVTSEDNVTHEFTTPGEMISFYNEIKALALAEDDDLTATTYRPILMRRCGVSRTVEAREIRELAFEGQEELAEELISQGLSSTEAGVRFLAAVKEEYKAE